MFRIVIDTNVIVAALRSRRGSSFELLMLLGDPRFKSNISVALAFEYEEVLKRYKNEIKLTDREIEEFVSYICSKSILCEIFYLWRPALPDAEDDFILELAIESNAEFIVTFNLRDFSGRRELWRQGYKT
ncbi:MAG: putative toxin-antitoxin system toxin component, PIN family [Pyrinomonadaceae bacterium]